MHSEKNLYLMEDFKTYKKAVSFLNIQVFLNIIYFNCNSHVQNNMYIKKPVFIYVPVLKPPGGKVKHIYSDLIEFSFDFYINLA